MGFLCLSWWSLLLVCWVCWGGGGLWLSLYLHLQFYYSWEYSWWAWEPFISGSGEYRALLFWGEKEGRKWFLHHIKFPITLAQAMKLVHRAGLKKTGKSSGKNQARPWLQPFYTNECSSCSHNARRKKASEGWGEGENEQRKRRGSESGELGTGMESKGVLEETEFSKNNGQNWKWTW